MIQKVRRILTLITLLLFPVVLNFLSPYVCIDGAMNGLITGSLLLFGFFFVIGIFFGRAWCSWVCPISALSEFGQGIQNKPVNRRRMRIIRYSIFGVWAAMLILMFILAGGVRGLDPLHMTTYGISVDQPLKYIIYYFVLALIVALTLTVGRRGFCQSVCWMAPFLTAGYHVGRWLHIPQLRIKSDARNCTSCGQCTKKCPMSIDVEQQVKKGVIQTSDCILCGLCIEGCKKTVLHYGIKNIKRD